MTWSHVSEFCVLQGVMLYGIALKTLAQSENKFELILTIIVDQQTILKSSERPSL